MVAVMGQDNLVYMLDQTEDLISCMGTTCYQPILKTQQQGENN